MRLPILSSLFKKTPPSEYFLAFLLRDEHVHAVVFEEIGGRIQVVGQGKAELPSSLETLSQENLLNAADKAISIAEQSLPEGIQTHKTVFGVKESWVEDSHISKDYLSKLKQMSEELDLQPIGFLVFPEAIAHLLQKEEGAPVSGILVDAGKKQVSLTLIRAGRIIETKEVLMGESLIATVENALKQFENVEIFPSRLILFDNGNKTVEHTFISHHWSKALPFLHVPQVSTLSSDFDTRAILFGTATQMGFDAIDLVKAPPVKHPMEEELPLKKDSEEETNVIARHLGEDSPESGRNEETKQSAAEIQDQVRDDEEEENAADTEDLHNSQEDDSKGFGFVKDEDIVETQIPHPTHVHSDSFEEIPEEVKEEEEENAALGFSASGPAFVEGAKKTLANIKRGLPRNFSIGRSFGSFFSNLPHLPGGGNKLVFLVPGILILLVIFFIWYIFGIHATATLSLTPKIIEQNQSVTFSTTGSTDPTSGTIAGSVVSAAEDGKVSGNATGSKDVGDKAKGTVTIFNNNDSSKSLDAGTTITSANGLKFTLDKDITVASASGDVFSGTQPGKTDVTVTAADIGTEYNLPSDTKFSVGGSSTIAAKNDNAFSGGSKKTITVVTQKDLDNLSSQLTDNLSDKAKQDLLQQADSDMVILPNFTKTTLSKSSYDKKVGDQASTINLSGTVSYQSLSYKKSDIDAYTKAAMKDQLPTDLTLSPKGITYEVNDLVEKDGSAKASLDMKAYMIPKIDSKTLASQIAGKSFAQAKEILSGTPQFSDVTFKLSPNLFFLPQILPRLSGNISLTATANE